MRQETLIDTTTMFNAISPVAQLPRSAPKLKGVDQVRQSSIELNFVIPISATNINATNFAEHRKPYPDPDVRNLRENSTLYYPLRVFQSPIRINVTVYVVGDVGLLEGTINSEQFVQVQTPKTANLTTFEAAPVMQFNIMQRSVPSIIALRLQNVKSGYRYSIRSFDVVLA
jgi:hypothetical protein